jgi:hypothetical protein
MITTFTPDDVLRYVYQETDPQESALMEQVLAEDDELMIFYLQALGLKQQLEKLEFEPSSQVTQHILLCSRH